MIENFIIEKLLELIPTKNKRDVELQNEMNKIDFIPKTLNFSQECFRIANKIKKSTKNPEIKKNLSIFKKQIVGKSSPKETLTTLYSITKMIKEENFLFEKELDKEMAEIDLSISLTSLEIQIEELLKTKIDFSEISSNVIENFSYEILQTKQPLKNNLFLSNEIINSLFREIRELKETCAENKKEISELKSTIQKLQH